jgi:uncharacterized protein YbaP (TraB family)
MKSPKQKSMSLVAAAVMSSLLVSASARAGEPDMFAEVAAPRGFLYEAHRGKRTVYLFGTLHIGAADYSPFTRAVLNALSTCKQVVFEVDPTDMLGAVREMQTAMNYPAGDALAKHLDEHELKALAEVLAKQHVPAANIAHTQLWAVPMVLELSTGELDGLSASYGTESFIGAYAKTHSLPIGQLETATQQIGMLSGAPDAIQHDTLAQTLDDLHGGKSHEKLAEIAKVWRAGDRVALAKLGREMHASKHSGERWFAEHLVDRRNVSMSDGIERLAVDEAPIFVAIGSLHLIGPHGVAAELARRGWHVIER